MSSPYQKLKRIVYERLINPILQSVSPVNEVAWGTAIGLFLGLTPTVGIQMWLAAMAWLLCRYVFRFRFDLLVGTAMVWISNPLTMFFMYYGFLVTGEKFFSLIGIEGGEVSYESFKESLSLIADNPEYSKVDIIWESSRYLILDLGYPMVIGSLFYAIPCSIISFFLVRKGLMVYRQNKAVALGMSYEEWREKYEQQSAAPKLKRDRSKD